ncbi:hypothetical protein [Cylindrospermopsis raciborskii]|uniref:hypothetical protein n=1 Tax=Cylindrospermopsis raciborskii TaxID=77022 RepID=UPI0022C9D111|nr:hypothetical protein [Cylindrospermopsis raciborskii]MCZ2207802.1 hypothetical protein [Cylindrospermopsis raciborskii PAMP2011]
MDKTSQSGTKIHADILLTIAKTIQNISQQQQDLNNQLENLRHAIITDVSTNIFEDELAATLGRKLFNDRADTNHSSNTPSKTPISTVSNTSRQNSNSDRHRLEEANNKRRQFGNITLHDTRFRRDVDTMPRRTTRIMLAPQLPFATPRGRDTEKETIRNRREI